ncbi:glycosyl hydrolase [Ectopseudomonas mendocina]|uniref:Glycosyl hydrolase n=1 Tax=Ectopseudomonas mendocina TaxID=300 RepID=A0ABZ2RHF0_ECTME
MSNIATSELSLARTQSPGIGARLMKLMVALLPWVIIAALLWAGIFIRPQPVGSTITPAALESRDQFYGLAQVPGADLLAVGFGGKILKIAGDSSVTRATSPVKSTLQDVATWANGNAVAVGNDGVVLYSADKGNNWQQAQNVPRSDVANKLNRVRAFADGLAIAAGEMGALLISRDYGHTWQRLRDEEDVAWNDVALLGSDTLLVVGEFGRVIRGSLSGYDWQEVDVGIGSSLMAVTFHDELNGTAVGLEGMVLQTTDGGLSWLARDAGLTEHLFDVAWLADQQRWFVTGALGRWSAGNGERWQTGILDERNLAWHVRALPVDGGLWLAGANIGHWDGKAWSLLQP